MFYIFIKISSIYSLFDFFIIIVFEIVTLNDLKNLSVLSWFACSLIFPFIYLMARHVIV